MNTQTQQRDMIQMLIKEIKKINVNKPKCTGDYQKWATKNEKELKAQFGAAWSLRFIAGLTALEKAKLRKIRLKEYQKFIKSRWDAQSAETKRAIQKENEEEFLKQKEQWEARMEWNPETANYEMCYY